MTSTVLSQGLGQLSLVLILLLVCDAVEGCGDAAATVEAILVVG